MLGTRSSYGTGCIISGNRILTNAHVVSNHTFIQVRKYGQSKRVRAKVLNVFHTADLALLTVEEPGFFDDVIPLEFGALPELQEKVTVYGFPLGGDTLSVTTGIVSRIEHRSYAHSSAYLLAGQIDAAINPGNSGGPVMQGKNIVGVVMQAAGSPQAENIGYMVPAPIIKHYLEDLKDSVLSGIPQLGIYWQTLENQDLKKSNGLKPEETGVLVNQISADSPLIAKVLEGDIIRRIDGIAIADDGTIELRKNERTSFGNIVQMKQIGENITIDLVRDGKEIQVEVLLSSSWKESWLIPMETYDQDPDYYIYGGLVFTRLSKNLLKSWGGNWYGSAPKQLVSKLRNNLRKEANQEIVVLLKVLASEITEGYHNQAFWIIEEVNGKKVLNLDGLVTEIKNSSSDYLSIVSEGKRKIVIDRKKAEKGNSEILSIYKIPRAYSSHFINYGPSQ